MTDGECILTGMFSCFEKFNRTVCPLRVAVDSFPPWIEVRKSKDGIRLVGVLVQLLDSLSLSMKIKFIIVPIEETSGEERINNTWNGIVGSVYRKEADLGLVSLTPTQSAFRAVDFTQPYHIDHLIVLSGIPDRLPTYVNVFQPQVWLGLVISLVVLLFVGIVVDRAQQGSDTTHHRMLRKIRIISANLLNQEMSDGSYALTRFLMLIWLLVSSVIAMQCINFQNQSDSNVVNIESVEDLVKYPHMKVLAPKSPNILKWLMESRERAHRILGRRMKEDNDSFLPTHLLFSESSLDRVERREWAIVAGSSTIKLALSKRYQEKNQCRMHLGKKPFLPLMRSIAMRKDATKAFKETINLSLNDIAQSHLFTLSLEAASSNYTKCLVTSDQVRLLNRNELQNTLIIWMGGISLVFLFMVIETIIFKKGGTSPKRLALPPIPL